MEISRIEKAIKNKSFCEHCFSSLELEYINNRPGSAAVCFAAKEAYSKALGTGIRGFSLKDIEVFHDQLNKPYIKAYNAAARDDSFKIFLTLSHCREYAVAYVVIEKTERG